MAQTEGLIPARYAKALLKVASERNVDQSVYQLMLTLRDSFAANPELQQAMANPFTSDDDKSLLLHTAAGTAHADNPTFDDFVKLLSVNRRLDAARAIALAYIRLYEKNNKIYNVTIRSAAHVSPDETNRIVDLIKKRLPADASVKLTRSIEPHLIGGFIVDIDNDRLDSSVSSRLRKMRHDLTSI